MKFLRDESLKKHNSFRIGGMADYFCLPRSVEDIRQALAFAKENRLPTVVFGAGTNLLVLDRGFSGLAIKFAQGLDKIKFEGNRVRAESGVLLPKLIRSLAAKGLSGLEFLAGIPGTVGGALAMNAGAWGKEIGRFVEQAKVLDKNGVEKTLTRRQLGFGYRRSKLQKSTWIVTEVTLKLRRQKKKFIRDKINSNLEKRRCHQPLGSPNCGSIFKNPKGYFAGRLIEEAGCKGKRVGDAQVSGKHANFIINLGDAKARDVTKLMTAVQKAVKEKTKILLEPEIKIMVKSST